MLDETHTKAISKIVFETLREDFENVNIIDVRISESDPFGDEELLQVEVIFGDFPSNAKGFSRLVRHVRPKLLEIKEWRFPVFTFTHKDDVVGGKSLAAT